MRKIFTILFSLTLFVNTQYGQETLAIQDFSGGTPLWNNTTDPAPFDASCASGDVWNNVASLNNINTLDGNFWGVQDLNAPCGTADFGTLTFPNVTIPTGYTGTVLSFDYDVFEYDNGDEVKYEVFIGGVSQGEVILVDGASNLSANGTVTIPIPDGSTTVSIIISVKQNGGGDYAGFDNIQVVSNPILPINLVSFSLSERNDDIQLNWITASEINNEKFEIERSRDGVNFGKIGEVDGNGDSSREIKYNFVDNTPVLGSNYYRLKQVDFDGKFEYSDIVIAKSSKSRISIYPTSATDYITVDMDEQQNASVLVINEVGQTLKNITISETNTRVDISDLPTGMYFVQVSTQFGKETQRIIKQ